jgi:O-antigen/teichoic acid export membrane protein
LTDDTVESSADRGFEARQSPLDVDSRPENPPMGGTETADLMGRFSRGSLTYGIGSALQRGIGFLLLPVYANFLTPAEFGIVGIVLAVFSAFSTVFGLGLRGAVTRQYFDYVDEPARLREYLGSVYTVFLACGILGAGALTLFGRAPFEWVFAQVPFDPFAPLALWAAFFSAASGILLSLYRAREQAGRYVLLELTSTVALAGFVVYLVAIRRGGAEGQAYALFWSSVVVFGLTISLLVTEARPGLDLSMMRSALAFGLPITIHLLASWALLAADRVLLERMAPLAEVGLYTLGYQLAMVVGVVASSSNSAWTPIFYDEAGSGGDSRRRLGRLASVNVALSFGAALLIVLFGPELVTLVADAEYARSATVIPVIALGYACQALYFVTVTPIFFTRRTQWLPLLTACSAALNVGLNLLLIPRHGMMGAAWATLAAFAFLFAATAIVARRRYRVEYEVGTLGVLGGIVVAGVLLVWAVASLPLLVAVPLKLVLVGAFGLACARLGIAGRLRSALGET